MLLVRFALAAADGPAHQSEAELLHDALWAHLGHGHGVEHITATAVPTGIDLVVFLSHDFPAREPADYARRLLTEASAHSPLAHRWLAALNT